MIESAQVISSIMFVLSIALSLSNLKNILRKRQVDLPFIVTVLSAFGTIVVSVLFLYDQSTRQVIDAPVALAQFSYLYAIIVELVYGIVMLFAQVVFWVSIYIYRNIHKSLKNCNECDAKIYKPHDNTDLVRLLEEANKSIEQVDQTCVAVQRSLKQCS